MATVIGLCIRIKLLRSLPNRFKVDVFINPGTHSLEKDGLSLPSFLSSIIHHHSSSHEERDERLIRKGWDDAVNKQLNDKERVAAALENKNLLDMINGAIGRGDPDE